MMARQIKTRRDYRCLPSKFNELNGRHVGTRTPDLYRVKVEVNRWWQSLDPIVGEKSPSRQQPLGGPFFRRVPDRANTFRALPRLTRRDFSPEAGLVPAVAEKV